MEGAQTRPLSIRNCDAKIVSGSMTRALAPAHSHHVVETARGFVAQRQLSLNAVDLDAAARSMGLLEKQWAPAASRLFLLAILFF